MKNKSFNKLPTLTWRLVVAVFCSLGATYVIYLFGFDWLRAIQQDLYVSLASVLPLQFGIWPGDIPVIATIEILLLIFGFDFAYSSYSRFHNGVWKGEKPSKNSVYGSARLLTKPRELRKAFDVWKKNESPKPGIVVGGVGNNHSKLLVNTAKSHTLVLGGTGSGKTTSVLLPSLVELIDAKTSFVALDPKGELFTITGKYAKESGVEVVVVDFSSPRTSDGWLPLQTAIDCKLEVNGRTKEELPGEVRILANTLIPDRSETSPIWTQAARILFSGLCSFVIESEQIPMEYKNLSTVAALAFMPQEMLQAIVENLDRSSAAYLALSSIAYAPAETYGGFAVNLNTALSAYADSFISPLLAKSDFSVEDFLEKQVCLYIKFNSSTEAFNNLITAFVEQLIDSFRRLAENRCGGKLPKPVYFILEELPQLPKFSLGKTLAICRSQGIFVTVCIQARSMLEAIYKEDSAGIFNNLSTTIFLQSEDLKTNKFYSDLLGNYTVEIVSRSQSKNGSGGGSTKSYSYHQAKLFSPDDLREWNYKTGHLVIANGKPYACSSLPISKTFAGDKLGLKGREPNEIDFSEFALSRPEKNLNPAPQKTWNDIDSESGATAIASAINSDCVDPRLL